MAIRLALKIAIFAAGHSQRQIAAQCGIHENRLSEIVRGWISPRDSEREAIAAALGKPVDELFEPRKWEQHEAPVTAPATAIGK